MAILETLVEAEHIAIIGLVAVLEHLKEVAIVKHLITIDRERYQHANVVLHCKVTQCLYLLGI